MEFTTGLYRISRNIMVNSGIIYFEDFFQFFSFAAQLPAKDNFYTYPLKVETGAIIAQPKKTDDTTYTDRRNEKSRR